MRSVLRQTFMSILVVHQMRIIYEISIETNIYVNTGGSSNENNL
jgi:hypothetical protein